MPETKEAAPKAWTEGLSEEDRKVLKTGHWLNDKLVNAAQKLLKQQFPHVPGFQDTLLGQTLSFEVHAGIGVRPTYHWAMVSTIGCGLGEITVYDSMSPHLTTSLK